MYIHRFSHKFSQKYKAQLKGLSQCNKKVRQKAKIYHREKDYHSETAYKKNKYIKILNMNNNHTKDSPRITKIHRK